MRETRNRENAALRAAEADGRLSLYMAAGVAAATLAAFWPVLRGGFVNWDDDVNILQNPNIWGLGWAHLRWMFTTRFMGPYQPLSWLSLGLDYALWGLNPRGYHLTSLLLHAANAVVFFALCRRLLELAKPRSAGEKPWALPVSAAFAALLFSIHPLRAESVAWVTERRDVLSGLFYLLTLWFYLPEPAGGRRRLGLSAACFALSLSAKGLGMTLPAILLVLDAYPLRQLSADPREWFSAEYRRVWLEKLPFVALAGAAAALAYIGQEEAGVVHGLSDYGVSQRLSTAFFNLSFYIEKTLLPTRLYQLYEAPKPVALWGPAYWPRAAAVVALAAALIRAARKWPAGLAAWLCYAIALLPVMGIVKFGQGIAADRYSYLSCMGWAVLGGAALREALGASQAARTLGLAAALAAASTLGWAAQRQALVWHDSESLWRHFLAFVPDHVFGNNNLGNVLSDQKRYNEAIFRYKIALSVDTGNAFAHYNLGNVYAKTDRPEEAAAEYRAALRTNPDYAEAKRNLAVVEGQSANARGIQAARQGRLKEAVSFFRSAVQSDPRNVAAANNLGTALSDSGRLGDAEKIFKEGLAANPQAAELHNAWAVALLKAGRAREAAEHFRRALELKSDFSAARNNYGVLLADSGKPAEAEEQYRLALKADPNYADAHFNLGNALAALGRRAEAAEEYRKTLQLQPGHPRAALNLRRLSGR